MIIVIVVEVQALIIQVVLAIVILDLLVLEMITVVGQAHLAEAQVIFIMNGMVDGLMKKAMNIMIITIQIQEIHMIPMEIIKEIWTIGFGINILN